MVAHGRDDVLADLKLLPENHFVATIECETPKSRAGVSLNISARGMVAHGRDDVLADLELLPENHFVAVI
ncbi:Hypothetical Protein FCC1311_117372 [Hondaea fermentalgiana]|uniref:Uncharacterized protein n=1 Tax=Hondaea fermentalgiana TaxID=2315210 RepID=A0A2R5FD93_9STRA|nr:Hypothetical Protein FCC1311_117372 [Hondaea fermentalgiana]|eukprot:GBG16262.1 Hypothetical Protein FCC1311_117372 [Hondaea fermentalgiana]